MEFKIKSMSGQIHDNGAATGCLPYKIIVMVEMNVKVYNKMCPIVRRSRPDYFGKSKARRDLGTLVVNVNNAVYDLSNKLVPAHYPNIDYKGERKAKAGIKTLEFVYFMGKSDWQAAETLGFEHFKFKNGDVSVKCGQYINLLEKFAKGA